MTVLYVEKWPDELDEATKTIAKETDLSRAAVVRAIVAGRLGLDDPHQRTVVAGIQRWKAGQK